MRRTVGATGRPEIRAKSDNTVDNSLFQALRAAPPNARPRRWKRKQKSNSSSCDALNRVTVAGSFTCQEAPGIAARSLPPTPIALFKGRPRLRWSILCSRFSYLLHVRSTLRWPPPSRTRPSSLPRERLRRHGPRPRMLLVSLSYFRLRLHHHRRQR